MLNRKKHWSSIYHKKSVREVSWYQVTPTLSLELIRATQAGHDAHIIDAGAGASTLVDHLLAEGYGNISLLDIAEEALQITQNRIKEEFRDQITWITGDITSIALAEAAYDIWHDRAVFHFLTEPEQREAYLAQMRQAVKPGGHVIIASFALDGPDRCSDLQVQQYDADTLQETLGTAFSLISFQNERHLTPGDSEQQFIYCHFRRN